MATTQYAIEIVRIRKERALVVVTLGDEVPRDQALSIAERMATIQKSWFQVGKPEISDLHSSVKPLHHNRAKANDVAER